jgi:hypothetical protein
VDEANNAWLERYEELKRRTLQFTDCFYGSTLPEEVLEAVAANLSILKSPTVLRQADGRLWGWEGCHDGSGCCDAQRSENGGTVPDEALPLARIPHELKRALIWRPRYSSKSTQGFHRLRTMC